jgi:hypothetical protein
MYFLISFLIPIYYFRTIATHFIIITYFIVFIRFIGVFRGWKPPFKAAKTGLIHGTLPDHIKLCVMDLNEFIPQSAWG